MFEAYNKEFNFSTGSGADPQWNTIMSKYIHISSDDSRIIVLENSGMYLFTLNIMGSSSTQNIQYKLASSISSNGANILYDGCYQDTNPEMCLSGLGFCYAGQQIYTQVLTGSWSTGSSNLSFASNSCRLNIRRIGKYYSV